MRRRDCVRSVPALLTIAVLAVAVFACSKSPTSPSATAPPPTHPLPTLAEMLSEKTLGSSTAAVTMIDYSSLTCPHCADFDVVTFPLIKSTYIDTGRVKFVYRDFPLNDAALAASMIARCSGDRFFTTIDTLYRNQASWANTANYTAALKVAVSGIGITSDDVDACLAVAELRAGVLTMQQTAIQQYSVNAVPTFLINGTTVLGALSFTEFAAIIDAM
jgi:protein-disulfide isomerase